MPIENQDTTACMLTALGACVGCVTNTPSDRASEQELRTMTENNIQLIGAAVPISLGMAMFWGPGFGLIVCALPMIHSSIENGRTHVSHPPQSVEEALRPCRRPRAWMHMAALCMSATGNYGGAYSAVAGSATMTLTGAMGR